MFIYVLLYFVVQRGTGDRQHGGVFFAHLFGGRFKVRLTDTGMAWFDDAAGRRVDVVLGHGEPRCFGLEQSCGLAVKLPRRIE